MTIRKYAPKTTHIYSSDHGALREVPVKRYIAHNPGAHPENSPIRADMYALEMQTDFGTRWHGFVKCYIDSSLRMVCELAENQERDEVIAKWENVK